MRHTSRRVNVRKGSISAPGFRAVAYRGGIEAFRGRIAVDRGSGMTEFPNLTQLARILREEGIPASAATQAFGAVRSNPDDAPDAPKAAYGPRRMKLAHFTGAGWTPGVRRGSLALLDKRAKSTVIVWGVVETDEGLKNAKTNRKLMIGSVLKTAAGYKIPTQAVYEAFGHLLNKKERHDLLASLHGR